MSNRIGFQRGCIVAAHFIDTRSERSRAVVIADDNIGIARKSALEIRANRCNKDKKHVLIGRMYTHFGTRTDEQRTDIKRGSALVGGHVFLIKPYHFRYHLHKQFTRNLGHKDAAACRLQT